MKRIACLTTVVCGLFMAAPSVVKANHGHKSFGLHIGGQRLNLGIGTTERTYGAPYYVNRQQFNPPVPVPTCEERRRYHGRKRAVQPWPARPYPMPWYWQAGYYPGGYYPPGPYHHYYYRR